MSKFLSIKILWKWDQITIDTYRRDFLLPAFSTYRSPCWFWFESGVWLHAIGVVSIYHSARARLGCCLCCF